MSIEWWRNHYDVRGFKFDARFDDKDDPYELWTHPRTMKKARLYDSGRVIETDFHTGNYFLVQREENE